MTRDELEQLLKNLHLKRIAELLDEELAHANKTQLAYESFLVRLLPGAVASSTRDRSHLENQTGSGFPSSGPSSRFPSKSNPVSLAASFAPSPSSTSSPKPENIVLIGPTGVGKTGLAIGLLMKALQNGHRCLFVRAQDLFDDRYASLADRSSRKTTRPARPRRRLDDRRARLY